MVHNSFLHPLGQVAFGSYQPGDVEEALEKGEALAWANIDGLLSVTEGARTFENSALALAEAPEALQTVCGLVGHLARVVGEEWHALDERASEKLTLFANQLRFHRGLYQALRAVRHKAEFGSLSAAKQKFLNEVILNYERDGIGLPEDQQEHLKEIASQMSAASVTFRRNAVEASDAAGLHLAGVSALEGMNEEFIDKCLTAAQEKGLEGYWVPFSGPNFAYLMANCRVRPTRQAFYRLSVSIAGDQNFSVAQQLLELRRRMAGLLGYPDYSDYVLELRMAKNGATATAFIDELTDLYRGPSGAEHEELTAFARKYEGDPVLELDASDVMTGLDFYYATLLRGSQVGLDEEQLRDYFSLAHVRDVLFGTLGQLYNLTFRPSALATWHPDVEVYEIWDGDDHLSTVWCDWYARKGKGAGAWADAFWVAPRPDGKVERPTLGCVVCNFPEPDSSGESRLGLRDVETMWHEFGHFVHVTCGMTELRQQSSFACRWDFVEAPSQIMENWVWQPEIMAELARHVRTGEGLPDDVMSKLLEGRRFRAATKAMRQLSFAAEDLALHRSYGGTSPADLLAFHQEMRSSFFPVRAYPEDASIATFTHIFGGEDYASAYYSYKWAEAIEADLFSAFLPDKLLSREVGARYRNQVLARGAEEEPAELIKAFLGRGTSPAAMLARDGIAVPSD